MLRVFFSFKRYSPLCMGRRNRKKKGEKGRGKGGVDERKGVSDGCLALPCVLLWLVVTHHPTCFLLLFIHNHTHLPLLVLCLVLSFSLSLSFSCLCVLVMVDGHSASVFSVSVVPPVAITPPPPTPAGLGPASFLPVPRTHPSVLSSSSSSSCCCCKVDGKASEGFTNHTPPLCFVACPSLFCCLCGVLCCGLVGMVGGGVGCHATLV